MNNDNELYYVRTTKYIISLSSLQVVEYEADERGFKPRISVEPVDDGSGGGYDDNAQDLARGAGGPY